MWPGLLGNVQKYSTRYSIQLISSLTLFPFYIYCFFIYTIFAWAQVKACGSPRRVIDICAGLIIIATVDQKASTWQGRWGWINSVSMDGWPVILCPPRDSHSVFNLINTSSEGGKMISFRRIHFIQGESLELDYSFMEGLKNCFRKLCIEHCSKLLIQSFNYANQWIKKQTNTCWHR